MVRKLPWLTAKDAGKPKSMGRQRDSLFGNGNTSTTTSFRASPTKRARLDTSPSRHGLSPLSPARTPSRLPRPHARDPSASPTPPARIQRRPARTPSTSPPPPAPTPTRMQPGDDVWIMVEDEFLSTAQLFTSHLHHAEYKRQRDLAKQRTTGGNAVITRPVDPRATMSKETSMRKDQEARRKRIDEAVGSGSIREPGSDHDEDEDEKVVFGNGNLAKLMNVRPRGERRKLLGHRAAGRNETKAAASPTSIQSAEAPTSTTAASKTTTEEVTAEADEKEEDDDNDDDEELDLDATPQISRAPSRKRPPSKPTTLSSKPTPPQPRPPSPPLHKHPPKPPTTPTPRPLQPATTAKPPTALPLDDLPKPRALVGRRRLAAHRGGAPAAPEGRGGRKSIKLEEIPVFLA